MENKLIDLHVHSTESDGTLTPPEVMQAAKDAGLAAVALTDHDTASGIQKAKPAAAKLGVELVPGIELSTEYTLPATKEGKEIHIVGLYINPEDPTLTKMTAEFRACRENRNEKIVEALQKEGFHITMKALIAENPDSVITRANIARFLFHHGYIKSISEAFEKYIGDGCPCYIERFKVTPMEAVALIKQAGGVAVLAHPMLYHMDPDSLQRMIDDLKEPGLDGIEALYSTYTADEESFVLRLAEKNRLLISGGSDFHGTTKPSIRLGSGKGNLRIPYSVLEALKSRAARL